ncbi:gas vesicle protein [Actinomadura craniellae]|uniref:Gas vesicle protein A n=1 Tax=Actinomadura craniellae TaxID=2231787 RepID=A0A365H3D7_9ACTN|nr:gas vesicle protein GvpJ [Actinomadura craniellae]RAY13617.1 gas vesicle protein [Actinomadura craniellae]
MTVVQPGGGGGSSSGGLADVIDTILDKGLVIDAYVSVSLLGIQLLTIDARIVVASVDTYLQFAEATNRLDLAEKEKPGVPDLVGGILSSVTGGGGKERELPEGAGEEALAAGDEQVLEAAPEPDEAEQPAVRRRNRSREG